MAKYKEIYIVDFGFGFGQFDLLLLIYQDEYIYICLEGYFGSHDMQSI